MKIIKEWLPLPNENEDTAKAYLKGYLHDVNPEINVDEYPAVIITPGGAYKKIPEHQSETIAMAFYNQGYQAFFVKYHFVSDQQPLLPAPMIDLANAVKTVRWHSADWHVDLNKVVLYGYSVGGNIVSIYNGSWYRDWLQKAAAASADELQPNAVILGYPVIDLQAGWPKDAEALKQLTPDPDEFAAQKLVTENNAPTFVWTTTDDNVVPSRNSVMYVDALNNHHVPVEFHMFRHGHHGLALANKQTAADPSGINPHVAHWFELAMEWLDATLQ